MANLDKKAIFLEFLKETIPNDYESVLAKFDIYLDLLYEKNRHVNLVSRRMPREDYWLYHFLDSLLVIKCIELQGSHILDWGTGGGLPGIPLLLAVPNIRMTLLDSVRKKVLCLKEFIAALHLTRCWPVWNRLEVYAGQATPGSYDFILCRSVKMEDKYREPLARLLSKEGRVIFYKARQTDDLAGLSNLQVFDVSRDDLGKRQIIVAPRQSFFTK